MRLVSIPAIALFMCAGGLQAQQMPQQLSLEEAQRLARLFNPSFRRMQNDLGVAEAGVRQSYGRFLPTLSSSLGFSGSHSSTLTTTDPFNRPISEARRVETEGSSASQGISLGMTLFDGGALFRNAAAARASQRATEARIDQDANLLRARVARDYFAALRADQVIQLEEQLLAARRDDLARTEKLLSVAASKYVDVLSARVDLASQEQTVDDARGNAEKLRLTLKQTLGLEGAANFSLTTEPPPIFDPKPLNVDALVRLALVSSPAIRQANAAVTEADKFASASRGSRWPRVTGGASYGRSTSARGFGAIGELDPPNRSLGFSIGVQLPLFSQFSTSYNIAAADAREVDTRESLRETRLAIERDVRAAFIDLGNAYRTVRLAEQRAELARELLAAAQEEYRLGTVTFFQIQQYADRAAQAQRQMLDARFNFVNNLIALEEKVGAPLER